MASLNAGPSCPGAHYSLSGWITDLLWFPLTQQPTASSLPEAYTSEGVAISHQHENVLS